MPKEYRQFVVATASLAGTIVGVGLFGLPYALAQVGVGLGIAYFVVLGATQLLQHLFFAEVAIASGDPQRLPGLVNRYIGPRAKRVAAVVTALGYWGGTLAYLIVGGMFLHALLGPLLGGSVFIYQVAWALAGAFVVLFGLSVVARVEFVGVVAFFLVMLVILGMSVPHVRMDHLPWFVAGGDFFLPYGVILFSLTGLPAIPEMEDIFEGRHERYRLAVVVGTLIAIALTAAFGFIVWGVIGPATSQDAVGNITAALGVRFIPIIAAFGFLAVATSHIVTALNLQSMFEYDFRFSRVSAWALTSGVPLAVFLIGATDFVEVVSFSGAVFGGISAVLVAMLYIAVTKQGAVKEKPLGMPLWTAYASIVLLTLGALVEMGLSARAWLS